MSAESLFLPQYVSKLKPEYAMYKLPFLPLPYWVCTFRAWHESIRIPDLQTVQSAEYLLCPSSLPVMEEAESDCCILQVLWFATRCMGTTGFDLELINCTIGKVSNKVAQRSCCTSEL